MPAMTASAAAIHASGRRRRATAAAATYAGFALLFGIRRSLNTKAICAGTAAALAVLIAGTRVLLGVHWLTDVIAGLILGWAWFAVCSIAFGGRFLRFGAPVEMAEQAASQQPVAATVSPPTSHQGSGA